MESPQPVRHSKGILLNPSHNLDYLLQLYAHQPK